VLTVALFVVGWCLRVVPLASCCCVGWSVAPHNMYNTVWCVMPTLPAGVGAQCLHGPPVVAVQRGHPLQQCQCCSVCSHSVASARTPHEMPWGLCCLQQRRRPLLKAVPMTFWQSPEQCSAAPPAAPTTQVLGQQVDEWRQGSRRARCICCSGEPWQQQHALRAVYSCMHTICGLISFVCMLWYGWGCHTLPVSTRACAPAACRSPSVFYSGSHVTVATLCMEPSALCSVTHLPEGQSPQCERCFPVAIAKSMGGAHGGHMRKCTAMSLVFDRAGRIQGCCCSSAAGPLMIATVATAPRCAPVAAAHTPHHALTYSCHHCTTQAAGSVACCPCAL
jgi:hypothetical protein